MKRIHVERFLRFKRTDAADFFDGLEQISIDNAVELLINDTTKSAIRDSDHSISDWKLKKLYKRNKRRRLWKKRR